MTPQNKHKKEESSFEEWLDITIEETYNKGYSEGFTAGKKVLEQNIGLLRQWLNEKPADLLVDNEHIKHWLSLSKEEEPNNPQDE